MNLAVSIINGRVNIESLINRYFFKIFWAPPPASKISAGRRAGHCRLRFLPTVRQALRFFGSPEKGDQKNQALRVPAYRQAGLTQLRDLMF